MSIRPRSVREIIYIGVGSFLPVVGQIIIATRPALSRGAKTRSCLYSLLITFVWLMLLPANESENRAEVAIGTEDPYLASREDVEKVSVFVPMKSCGKVGDDAELLYPVFLDNVDISDARTQFCEDAISSVRQDTGQNTVILASFSTLKDAQEFAAKVGGEVGEPDIVAENVEQTPAAPPQVSLKDSESPIRETIEEREQITIWQPPAEYKLVETDNSVPVGIKWDRNIRCDSWDVACVSIKIVPSEECEYLGAQLVFYDKSNVRLSDAIDYESNVSADEAVWLSFGVPEVQIPIISDYRLAEFECK